MLRTKQATPEIHITTSRGHLTTKVLSPAANGRLNAAPQPAYDLAVLARDKFVNDVAAMLIGNKTFSDLQMANWMQILTGKTPPALWVHERNEPWSLTTAERPLDVVFEDEQVRIAFHLAGAARGERLFDSPLTVAVSYTMEITRDGPHLVRSGGVGLDFADAEPSTDRRFDDFRQFLTTKFNALFPSDLYFDGLIPPAGGTWARLHHFSLTQLTAQSGWFAIGYTWSPKTHVAGNAPR
jgi:hypothetical protein